MRKNAGWLWASMALVCAVLAGSGCSVRKMALKQVGNALAGTGSTFASDNDPELVREAVPFSLKLIESVLAETPRHEGLLLAAASGFTQYAYAFVQQDADETEPKDLEAAEAMRARAKKLYLRARDFGLRGLEVALPGFEKELRQDPQKAAQRVRKEQVPLLYWTAAAWGSAISLSKDSPEQVGDLPMMEALLDRAEALDPEFGEGALHSFLITYEMARSGKTGDPVARARAHYERAVALSQGQQAGPMVSYAEAVCIQKQDLAQFDSLLQRALAIDVNARPEWRLVNIVMQRRAKWLLSRKEDLFLVPEK